MSQPFRRKVHLYLGGTQMLMAVTGWPAALEAQLNIATNKRVVVNMAAQQGWTTGFLGGDADRLAKLRPHIIMFDGAANEIGPASPTPESLHNSRMNSGLQLLAPIGAKVVYVTTPMPRGTSYGATLRTINEQDRQRPAQFPGMLSVVDLAAAWPDPAVITEWHVASDQGVSTFTPLPAIGISRSLPLVLAHLVPLIDAL